MPLHGHDEVIPGQLDSFDNTFGVACADRQTLTEAVDALVVIALHSRLVPEQTGQPTALHGAYGRGGELRIALLMAGVTEEVGEVLVQGATEGHIEHLGATADPEHRHATAQRLAQQRELPGVTVTGGGIGGRVRLMVVGAGVDVAPAGDDQRVDTVDARDRGSYRVDAR